MAEVHLARDTLLGRQVALKVLHPEFARDKSFIERFRREAQAAASLSDPRIVSIFDWGSDGGTYYIVMEFVDGGTLRDVIRDEGPLTPERAVEIASDVCGALEVAHQKGIVHRDVKPANIAITRSGQTKVMDFGIARAQKDAGHTVTATGTVIGTAAYLSPEQAQGMPVDGRSDVYAAGVVLYEMLTQEVPFKADTPVAVAYKHVKEDPVPPGRLNREVPGDVEAVVLKALAKNPDNRYQSAAEMRSDLQRLLRGQPVEATPVLPAEQTAMFDPADRTSVMPAPTTTQATGRRRTFAYILSFVFVAGVIVLLIALLASLFGRGAETVEVPKVLNDTREVAKEKLEKAGLIVSFDEEQPHDSIPAGSVMSQTPESGRKVEKRSVVNLTISRGPGRVGVPDLKGMTREEAAKKLEETGLVLGDITEEANPDVEAGRVLSQSPGPGERVEAGARVSVTVSSGKRQVRVPSVVGFSEERAVERLTDDGLTPEIKETCVTSEDNNKVLAQDPGAGSQVAEGSVVSITVNKAPAIPQVVGQSEESAKTELEGKGFKVQVIKTSDVPGKQDRVVDQDPGGGDQACKGDTVRITVED